MGPAAHPYSFIIAYPSLCIVRAPRAVPFLQKFILPYIPVDIYAQQVEFYFHSVKYPPWALLFFFFLYIVLLEQLKWASYNIASDVLEWKHVFEFLLTRQVLIPCFFAQKGVTSFLLYTLMCCVMLYTFDYTYNTRARIARCFT